MTIAACYISPEGVVLGADSTTTFLASGSNPPHYYNHAQKLFELGDGSTLGVVTWGLGGLDVSSHRTLLALFADDLKGRQPKSVKEVAERWAKGFWAEYTSPPIAARIAQCRALDQKPPFDPAAVTPDPNARTEQEEQMYVYLRGSLAVGFCIAGYLLPDRKPAAFEIIIGPLAAGPIVQERPPGCYFWGAPNPIHRLVFGCDEQLKTAIMNSGKWTGTRPELDTLVAQHVLSHPPTVPIREAIDFVHACISSTIKAFKFSPQAQICGGPIEIAVITTDRQFRWVRHKAWDAAITEGAMT